jgi:hypothetical protein
MTTTCHETPTAFIIVTTTGQRIHVGHSPDYGNMIWYMAEKDAIINEACNPMQINEIALRQLL